MRVHDRQGDGPTHCYKFGEKTIPYTAQQRGHLECINANVCG
jgi:hypothetical protein